MFLFHYLIVVNIFSHGSYGLWSSYLAGGEVVVADGYSDRSDLKTTYAAGALFPIRAAALMNWEALGLVSICLSALQFEQSEIHWGGSMLEIALI